MRSVGTILKEMDEIRYKQESIRSDAGNMKKTILKIHMNFDYRPQEGGRKAFYYTVEDGKLEADIKEVVLNHLRATYSANNKRLKELIEELKNAETDEI